MESLNNKKALLDSLRLTEGEYFEYNEKTILEEYNSYQKNESGLAIKVLSIFGGLLATLAFVGFLAIAGFNNNVGYVAFGAVFIIGAIVLNKLFNKLIIDTFSISIYIIGFILLSVGLLELQVDDNLIVAIIIAIAFSSLFVTQNYILSFISILIISGGFLTLILINEVFDLIHVYIAVYSFLLTYVFLHEAKIISIHNKISKLYNPLRISLIFSLLFGLITLGKKYLIPISPDTIWFSSIPMILLLLYIVSRIIKINEIESMNTKIYIYILSCIILLLTVLSPSISGAMIIILLSFMVNHKTGLAIGVIAFIYFISQYYYDLNFTLLTKSILMMSTGIVFLLLYFFTSKKLNHHEKV